MSKSYHNYHVSSRVAVQCSDCGAEWMKSKYTLKEWQGRCRKCAQKFEAQKPERQTVKSEQARAQVLRQGGIPNAVKFTSETTSGAKNVNWTGGNKTVSVACAQCKKEWEMDKSNFSRWKGCCHKCTMQGRELSPAAKLRIKQANSIRVKNQGGIPNARKFDGINNAKERHPNWKGGITPETMAIRQSAKYKQWRKDIFERDDYTCQICLARGGRLNADHYPTPFCKIFQKLKKTLGVNQADSFEPLWDLNNGRTLCEVCHKKFGWSFFKAENPRVKNEK